MDGDWLVVRTKPGQVEVARVNCGRQGTEFYCPQALMRGGQSRRLRPEPLFPGYAFARPAGPQWAFLNGTNGLIDVLMSTGTAPARVADAYIAALRGREGPDGLVVLGAAAYRVGERVFADEGPLSGTFGIVEETLPHDRLAVLFNMLGRQTRVEMDASRVSRA